MATVGQPNTANLAGKFVYFDPDVDRYLLYIGSVLTMLVLHYGYGWAWTFCVIVCTAIVLHYYCPNTKAAVHGLLFALVAVFFRESGRRGADFIRSTGATVFVVAPHANQFLDPLVVMKTCGRPDLAFLGAAKSFRRPFIGFWMKQLSGIPVERPQDLATPGVGTISVKGTRVVGQDTQFTKLDPACSIHICSEIIPIASVKSNTELELKGALPEEKRARAEEFQKYKVVPKVDQSEMYNAVYDHLYQGKAFGIFPEGGSHDRTELLPLKAGVALMAIGAMARHPGLDVRIIPVGLNYFSGDRFRSRVYADFGKPIAISPDLVERFKKGGPDKRSSCEELMGVIMEGLKAVTITAPNLETLRMAWAVRRLYVPSSKKLSTAETYRLTQRFVDGYELGKDHPQVKELRNEVLAYEEALEENGLADYQVKRTRSRSLRALRLYVWRCILLFLYCLAYIPGGIVLAPVALLARAISEKKRKKALAESSVKIEGADVIATWKAIIGFGVIPVLSLFYAIVIGIYFGSIDVATLVLVCFAPFLYISIKAYENILPLFRSVRRLRQVIIRGNDGQHLREMRAELKEKIRKFVDEDPLGIREKVYPDFNKAREWAERKRLSTVCN